MRLTLDEAVLVEGNRKAFEQVIGITQTEELPVMLYIYGPANSGKSFILQARAGDRDLLSPRKVVFSHAAEILTAIQLDAGEELLDEVGSADVLLLDAFDLFFEDEQAGPLLCKLLLKERFSLGLSTIIAGRKPLSAYDLGSFEGVLDAFEEVEVCPLDREGYAQLALNVQSVCQRTKEDAPTLSDEAIEFIVREHAQEPRDVRNAVQFLLTVAGFENGSTISAAEAREALTI